MSSFNDVSVGDSVLVPRSIRYGFSRSKTFYCDEKIKRVTKTQFVTDSGRFQKDGGSKIGERYARALHPGETLNYSDAKIFDQTKDFFEFKTKIKCASSLYYDVEHLPRRISINADIKKIELAKKKCRELREILEEIKEN